VGFTRLFLCVKDTELEKMKGSPLEVRITELINPSVEEMGLEVVRTRIMDGKRRTLQIMIDHTDGEKVITAKDCAKASRQISALLDVEDPISGEYDLEVSSPGIDRPLMREKDFARFAGYEVKLSVATAIEGRKHFKGVLLGIKGQTVQMRCDGAEPVDIDFSDITAAKLILTDALITAALKEAERQAAVQDETT